MTRLTPYRRADAMWVMMSKSLCRWFSAWYKVTILCCDGLRIVDMFSALCIYTLAVIATQEATSHKAYQIR